MDDNQLNRLRRMRREQSTPFKNETYLIIPYLLALEAMLAAAIEAFVAKLQLMGMDQFSFDEKIRIGAALGVLDEEFVAGFFALNRLRNKVAHRVGYHVTKRDLGAVRGCLPAFLVKDAEEAVQAVQERLSEPMDSHAPRVFFLQCICSHLAARIGTIGNIFHGMKGKIDEISYAYLQYVLARRDPSTVRGKMSSSPEKE